MSSINTFIKKHPVLCYYLLTFVISWGSVFFVVGGPGGFPANEQEQKKLLPLVVLALASGPIISGILMTALVSGGAGLREFLSRFLRWRVSASWYAVALLPAPFVVLATLLVLSLSSTNFLPSIFVADDIMSILLPGLAAGVVASLLEEPGWTGFAIPRLKSRYGIVATGLIVGFLWGLWHFIVALWGGGTPTGTLAMALFLSQLVFYFGVLPAYRVLMVWVYDRTESLFVAILMHGSLTAVTTFIFAPPVTDEQRVIYHLVLTVAMWIVVAVVAVATHGLSQQPLQKRLTQKA